MFIWVRTGSRKGAIYVGCARAARVFLLHLCGPNFAQRGSFRVRTARRWTYCFLALTGGSGIMRRIRKLTAERYDINP